MHGKTSPFHLLYVVVTAQDVGNCVTHVLTSRDKSDKHMMTEKKDREQNWVLKIVIEFLNYQPWTILFPDILVFFLPLAAKNMLTN